MVKEDDRRVMESKTTMTHEEILTTANGEQKTFLQTKGPLFDETGNLAGIFAILRDITDRKTYEEELQLTNQQLGLLTDITRHDILNKVMVIVGHLTLARKKFSDPEIIGLFDTIDTNIGEIKSQIEFTKMYNTLGTEEPQWMNIGQLISQLHVPSHITLQGNLSCIEIYADPLFRQVFINLLDNSEKYGGHVTAIKVSAQHSRVGLIIIWEDNGVGIPEKEKKKIFRRGYGKSSGLGLFLIAEILGITGIKIRETGIEGSCARFEIIVPKGAFHDHQHQPVPENKGVSKEKSD
jgi:signal transduction histidine kinase